VNDGQVRASKEAEMTYSRIVTDEKHRTEDRRYPFYRRLGGLQDRSGRAEHLVPTVQLPPPQHTHIYIYIISPLSERSEDGWQIRNT